MQIEIRKMRAQDRQAVEHICLSTAPPALNSTVKMREYTLLMYNRYYTRMVTDSFVAVNSDDEPIGYILCAPDYECYRKSFYENELKSIRKLGMMKYFSAKSEVLSMKKRAEDYPAHLHIDILPEYQHMGIGGKLMQALLTNLKNEGAKGVMLTVSATNKNGIAFYEKCGFTAVSHGAGIVFVMKL